MIASMLWLATLRTQRSTGWVAVEFPCVVIPFS